jgi:hypothetical protein
MSDNTDGSKEQECPEVYTLTKFVRQAGASRRVVIASFDVPLRGAIITGCAVFASILPMTIAWALVGQLALLIPPLFIAAVFYLVEARTRSGLRLRNYQAMVDKKRAAIGEFICYGKPVDPTPSGWGLIMASSMPSPYLKRGGDPSAHVIAGAPAPAGEDTPAYRPRPDRPTDEIAWG